MRRIVSLFVKFPFYANLIIVFLLIAGTISMLSMKKSFFPEVTSRIINISVFYPGASPVEMEEGVASRIEESVRGIIGIKEITSSSSENMSQVRIETTGEYDIDEVLIEVKNAVDGISSLPTAAERPIVYKVRSRSPAMYLALTEKKKDAVNLLTLKEYAQKVEEDFLNSGTMSNVSISGYPSLEISVEVHEVDLLRHNITFDMLSAAIAQNNRDVSGGNMRSTEEEMLIRLRSRSADPNKIANIILKGTAEGGFIRVRDIATVKKQFADVSSEFRQNGKKAISLYVQKLPEEDLEEITDYINDYVEDFNQTHAGVELEVSFAFMEMLQSRLNLLLENGLMGLVLVVICLALFLSVRLALWVAWGIPSAFLAMFIVANMVGITINMVSLFGMLLVIGILVDDGIVIGENIFAHYEMGKNPMRAAVDGTLEVVPAVITSILTTVVAFMPILLLKQHMEMMNAMAFVVIVSLIFSLAEAFFVLPSHLGTSHVLRPKNDKKDSIIRRTMDRFFMWLRDDLYGKLLPKLIKWRYIVVTLPVLMIMVTLGLFQGGLIRSTFFPNVEFDQFSINIAFTPGSGERQTKEYLERFEKVVWEVNDELNKKYGHISKENNDKNLWYKLGITSGADTSDIIARASFQLGSAFSGLENGSHAGSIGVFPKNLEGSGVSTHMIADMVRERIGEVPEAQKFSVAGRNRWGSPVSISLLGKNLVVLERARDYLISQLSALPELKDVMENNALGKQEVLLKLKPQAYFLGLTESAIANQVRQGFYGGQVQRLQEGRDELRVWVRYPAKDRENISQLERMKIKTSKGYFPLTELVDYDIKRGPVSIKRYNGSREIRVEAEMVNPDGSVPEMLANIKSTIIPELKSQFGVNVEFQGQSKSSAETQGEMGFYFSIAFAIMIFILMIHFKSFEQPILILAMIPLALAGAFWGHGIHGRPISILSAFGMVALTGVIINDAVVFLSRYNSLMEEGYKVGQAIILSGKSRLRPILITTLTTSIGLYPIILEKSFQAQFLIPMAISLVYGVAFGTIFILVFLPSLIMILNDIRVYRRFLFRGIKPEREEMEIAVIHSKRIIDESENYSGEIEDYRP